MRYVDGKETADIRIAVIEIPTASLETNNSRIHYAMDLADKYKIQRPQRFKHEYLFEWEVPASSIVEVLTVQSLVDARIDMDRYCDIWEHRLSK